MPISPALEAAIIAKLDILMEKHNNMNMRMQTLSRFIEDDTHLDDAILTLDPTFDLDAMYLDVVTRLQNYIKQQAQDIVDAL